MPVEDLEPTEKQLMPRKGFSSLKPNFPLPYLTMLYREIAIKLCCSL